MHQPSLFVLKSIFPEDVVMFIDTFIPYFKKEKPKYSPSLQKELTKIQNMKLKGISNTYLKNFYDFVLD